VSAAAIAKAAAMILSDERGRKAVGWIIVAVLSPLIVFAAIICALMLGGSQSNVSVADLCWYNGSLNNVPDEYRERIISMRESFAGIDAAVIGTGLDANELKSVFFVLFLTAEYDVDVELFVNYFIGANTETAYANVEAEFGITITDNDRANIAALYARIIRGGDTFSGSIERSGKSKNTELDVSGFVNPDVKNNLDLVMFVTNAWENGWGYVWGTVGGVLTESALNSKLEQYPDEVGGYEDFIRENWLGGRTADCAGLIKSYGWLNPDTLRITYNTAVFPDNGANSMYGSATVKGEISTMPDVPGLGVWHKGHIGVYVGNGEVVEAMGTRYGVVKTQLNDRSWTAWLELPGITYYYNEMEIPK
jgi:cell wall-associated NlpC family hydrolase